jgi:hypothetical protein
LYALIASRHQCKYSLRRDNRKWWHHEAQSGESQVLNDEERNEKGSARYLTSNVVLGKGMVFVWFIDDRSHLIAVSGETKAGTIGSAMLARRLAKLEVR